MSCRILVFAKAPLPGRVKTRLIPALGAEGAARLAEEMLEGTLAEAAAARVGTVELCTDPEPEALVWDRFRDAADRLSSQGEGDLGARLDRAARRVIQNGDKILLIGSDCPDLGRKQLRAAAKQLDTHDAVLHPASDGGYVLLGLRHYDPSLFYGIAWSTASVAEETIACIHRLGWSLHIGDTLDDVDEPADLDRSAFKNCRLSRPITELPSR